MQLAQTLAGTWHISVPNPEEEFWSTELASFDTTCTTVGSPAWVALEQAAAAAALLLSRALPDQQLRVISHDKEAAARMVGYINAQQGNAQ